MVLNKRILIGTVGYQLLGNHSIGPVLLTQIQNLDWPGGVVVEEMNWGPIAIVQYFEALEVPFDRIIFLVALERQHRTMGEVTLFQWKGRLPSETQIQACVGDAATGVISVENLLVIGEFFKIWPAEVFLVDVEPGKENSGEHLTPEVVQKIPEILRILEHLAINGAGKVGEIKPLYGNLLFEEAEP